MSDQRERTATEIDLCEVLRDWAERSGFDVYPEVSGWDLVLVPASIHRVYLDGVNPVEPGEQVGVHAKLRANCDVLAQALPPPENVHGYRYPTWPLVAVPNAGFGFEHIARHLGIGVVEADPITGARRSWWTPENRKKVQPAVRHWPRRQAHQLLELPPIASRSIVAGAPSPRILSEWRVKALRFLAEVRPVGTFRVSDLGRHGISKTWAERWGEAVDWATEVRRGKTVRVRVYQLVDRKGNLPDAGYKDVAEELWKHDADVSASRRDAPG